MSSNPAAPNPTTLPQIPLRPVRLHLEPLTIHQHLRLHENSLCLRLKKTDTRHPRSLNDLVHLLRLLERRSDPLTLRYHHLDPDLRLLRYPLKPEQVRILHQQEQYLKPPGPVQKLRGSNFLPQLTRKKLLKPLYGKPEKLRQKNFPPVEGHPLPVLDLMLPKLLRLLIKQKKLDT